MSQRPRFEWRRLNITRGALTVFGIQLGLSLIFMMLEPPMKAKLVDYIVATPSGVFEHGRVWTILTTSFLEPSFFRLLLQGFMMFAFVPTLERFWGTARFYRFVAATSIVGVLCGLGIGVLLGRDFPIFGLAPFTWAAVIAFGIVYARQPVQIWGVLPLTGRQMMYGFLAFLALYIGLQQIWEVGAAYAGAMATAAVMVSKKWSPGLAWKRWKIARARAKLSVLQGGAPAQTRAKRDEQKWLN